MQREDFHNLRDDLIMDAFGVSDAKSEDYTIGNEDALHNFKSVAERTGLSPIEVLGVYMLKHQDAISAYIKNGGQVESEPIKERIIDNINYLCLLYGLIIDLDLEKGSESSKRCT